MKFNPRWIVGKTVARVVMNTVRDATSTGGPSHDPEIIFTDGTSIRFMTEETKDAAYYGTKILYRKRKQK